MAPARSPRRGVDDALVMRCLDEELAAIRKKVGDQTYESGKYDEAAEILRDLVSAREFTEFLTLPAYERVITVAPRQG